MGGWVERVRTEDEVDHSDPLVDFLPVGEAVEGVVDAGDIGAPGGWVGGWVGDSMSEG